MAAWYHGQSVQSVGGSEHKEGCLQLLLLLEILKT